MREDKAGKTVRCPKCGHVFRVAVPKPPMAEWQLVEEDEPPPAVNPVAPETNRADDSPSEPTAKPRKKRFKKKSTVSLEQIQLIGGIVATLLGAGAAIWLALVLFGAAGTASEAYAQPAHYW